MEEMEIAVCRMCDNCIHWTVCQHASKKEEALNALAALLKGSYFESSEFIVGIKCPHFSETNRAWYLREMITNSQCSI